MSSPWETESFAMTTNAESRLLAEADHIGGGHELPSDELGKLRATCRRRPPAPSIRVGTAMRERRLMVQGDA